MGALCAKLCSQEDTITLSTDEFVATQRYAPQLFTIYSESVPDGDTNLTR